MKATSCILAAGIALCALCARSEDAKKEKGIEGAPVPQKMGKVASKAYRDLYVNNARDWLKNKDGDIIRFVNDKGCVPDKDGKKPLNAEAWGLVTEAAAAKTEVVFFTREQIIAVTGKRMAHAIGISADMKAMFSREMKIQIGTPGKHAIVLMSADGQPGDAKELNKDDPGGWPGRHEFLHIALRQLDNPALGGGERREDPAADIADLHHQLTDYLGWTQFKQSSGAWKLPEGPSPQCR